MEIHQLRYFVGVADSGSFTRAAGDLAVAQPSLSQQIAKLEREVGFRLFDRGPARVVLTTEGAQFLPRARAVLDRLAEAELAAREIRGVEQGTVVLGVSPIAGGRILPTLIRAIRKRFPTLAVETREAGLGRLLELQAAGDLDIAMVLLPAPDIPLITTPVLAEDLVVVLPADHSAAEFSEVELSLLASDPFLLLTAEYGLRQRVIEECSRAGFQPQIAFESREVGILQALAAAGLGVTVLPESAVRRDLATSVRPLLVAGETPQRQIGLAIRSDRYVTIAARAVFDLASNLFGSGVTTE